MHSTTKKSIQARSDIKSGTYDYANDSEEVIAYFGGWMGSSVFTSLENLQMMTNNHGITEEVYNSISLGTTAIR